MSIDTAVYACIVGVVLICVGLLTALIQKDEDEFSPLPFIPIILGIGIFVLMILGAAMGKVVW